MASSGPIQLKRVYEPSASEDGCRVLVDRLWPRGLTKRAARIDLWVKEAAPSTALRRWFDHRPERWAEFRRRYARELGQHPAAVERIRACRRRGPVTLVFASRELRFNNAVALKAYLERRRAPGRAQRGGSAALEPASRRGTRR